MFERRKHLPSDNLLLPRLWRTSAQIIFARYFKRNNRRKKTENRVRNNISFPYETLGWNIIDHFEKSLQNSFVFDSTIQAWTEIIKAHGVFGVVAWTLTGTLSHN